MSYVSSQAGAQRCLEGELKTRQKLLGRTRTQPLWEINNLTRALKTSDCVCHGTHTLYLQDLSQFTQHFTSALWSHLHNSPMISPILGMRKLRPRGMEWLVQQSHTSRFHSTSIHGASVHGTRPDMGDLEIKKKWLPPSGSLRSCKTGTPHAQSSATQGRVRWVLGASLPLAFKAGLGTSLVVQWLRFCTPNAGVPGSTPGQGTTSHMPQLRSLHATTKGPACCN